jgi:hypothetical protein
LGILEPWCSTIYCDADIQKYITEIQPGTPFDLKKRVKPLDAEKTNTILVSFDGSLFSNEGMKFITQLSKVLTQTADGGDVKAADFFDDKSVTFEHDIFKIECRAYDIFDNILVNNYEYGYKFVEQSKDDPYCMNELFRVFEHTKQMT